MRRAPRNEIRAGAITLSVISAVALSIIFGPALFEPTRMTYRLRVGPEGGVSGLRRDTPVSIGGLERGRVRRISQDDSSGELMTIVEFELAEDAPLFSGAVARIRRDPISNLAYLDFASVGSPAEGRLPRAAPELRLRGDVEDAAGLLPPAQSAALGRTLERLSGVGARFGPVFSVARTRFGTIREDAIALRDEISASWPALRERVGAVADRYRALGGEFEDLRSEARGLGSDFGSLATLFGEGSSFERLRALGSETATSFGALRENAQASLVPAMDRLRAKGREVQTAFAALRADFGALAAAMDFGEPLAKASLASEQLSRIYREATGAPWRLVVPNESGDDRRVLTANELSRRLLGAAERARLTEAQLRRLAEEAGPLGDSLRTTAADLAELLSSLDAIERAILESRLGADGAGTP